MTEDQGSELITIGGDLVADLAGISEQLHQVGDQLVKLGELQLVLVQMLVLLSAILTAWIGVRVVVRGGRGRG